MIKTREDIICLCNDKYFKLEDKVIIAVSPYGLFKLTNCGYSISMKSSTHCFCNMNSSYGGLSGINTSIQSCIKNTPYHTRFYIFDNIDEFVNWYEDN